METMDRLISGLNLTKACGLHGVMAKLLKDAGDKIIKPITHILNLSKNQSKFPSVCKVGLVTPIHKDGPWDDANNYRPIALLSLISKILEQVVHEQVYAFLHHTKFFTDAQLGFRKGHSITTCLLGFLDGIYDDIENGMVGVESSSWTSKRHLIQ